MVFFSVTFRLCDHLLWLLECLPLSDLHVRLTCNTRFHKKRSFYICEPETLTCVLSPPCRTFDVRVAVSTDMPAVQDLVKQLSLHESLLKDLDFFFKARQDPVCLTQLQLTSISQHTHTKQSNPTTLLSVNPESQQ